MKTLVSAQGIKILGFKEKTIGVRNIVPEIDDSLVGNNRVEVKSTEYTDFVFGSEKPEVNEQGVRMFVDESGDDCLEHELHFTDEDAGITTPQPLFPSAAEATTLKIPCELDRGQLHDIKALIERGMNDLSEMTASEIDFTDEDRDMAEATNEVGEMVVAAITEAIMSFEKTE